MEHPDLYEGREQTLIKHFIFGRYFQRFAHIVGAHWDSITFVDGFSGPWEARSSDFKDTSFGIALEELRKARETMEQKGKILGLRCFFIEKDKSRFQRLEQHASNQRHDVEIETFNGEFETAIPAILNFVQRGGAKTFPFIFIDPTGWTGYEMDKIAPLLKLPTLEVMINFMTGHVRRFIKDHPTADFTPLFGMDVRPLLQGLDGQDLDDRAVQLYSEELRRRGNFDFVAPAIVLNPAIDKTHFHLIYATRNAKGLEVFREAERDGVKVMNKTRAEVKVRKSDPGQDLLFGASEIVSSSHFDQLRSRYLAELRIRVHSLICKSTEVSYDQVWAEALRSLPLVWESDLKELLREWLDGGDIQLLGLADRERTPKRDHNHRIKWLRESSSATIYSIGHSNHTLEKFLSLLKEHRIQVLVDVRSYPYSQYSPQFHQIQLKTALAAAGVHYLFLGKELGGRPDGSDFYDSDGRVFYGRVAKTPLFRQGIERLKHGIQTHRVAIMCSEENPTECHRRLLVGRVLGAEAVAVQHIRGSGCVESEMEIALKDKRESARRQMGLFSETEDAEWKSIPSVLQKKPQTSSSDY